MNWLDIVLICLAGMGLVKGLFDGLIRQVVSLIALAAGIFFCGRVAVEVKSWLAGLDWFPAEAVTVASYAASFLLIAGVLILAGVVVHKIVGATPLGMVNHLFGGVFGILVTVLFVSLALNLLETVDKGSALIPIQAKLDSRYYYPVKEVVATVFPQNMFAK
ncbi:colicin V production protein [Bacteroidales bacterium Barb6XT]|nr:colicin V production protein [Bacteroidales bacterium Barb6XT]